MGMAEELAAILPNVKSAGSKDLLGIFTNEAL
jgi:hypothetical protein